MEGKEVPLNPYLNFAGWLICFLPSLSLAQTDTISVYFPHDAFQPYEKEIPKLRCQEEWQAVEIVAYTDYLGSTFYNLQLSNKRAAKVKEIMVQHGCDTKLIKKVSGLGELGKEMPGSEGNPENRRADIIIEYNPKEEKKTTTPATSLNLDSAKVGDHLVLEDFSFIPGRHFLLPQSQAYLDTLFEKLVRNPKLKIAIEGHVCCTGSDSLDGVDSDLLTRNLSVERAKYIYEQLIAKGISPERLSYKGFGRSRPIYPQERTPFEQQANRRVEIRILEK
jgi:outer membrane protein OmpA-like peptidoglycan-associated protein